MRVSSQISVGGETRGCVGKMLTKARTGGRHENSVVTVVVSARGQEPHMEPEKKLPQTASQKIEVFGSRFNSRGNERMQAHVQKLAPCSACIWSSALALSDRASEHRATVVVFLGMPSKGKCSACTLLARHSDIRFLHMRVIVDVIALLLPSCNRNFVWLQINQPGEFMVGCFLEK